MHLRDFCSLEIYFSLTVNYEISETLQCENYHKGNYKKTATSKLEVYIENLETSVMKILFL